jgi:hypothetical protein
MQTFKKRTPSQYGLSLNIVMTKNMTRNEFLRNYASEVVYQTDTIAQCDLCGSCDVKEIHEGYVCADCGVMLSITRLEYHSPYDKSLEQCAPRGKTQIGSVVERMRHSNSPHICALNRMQNQVDYESDCDARARIELSTILSQLQLYSGHSNAIFALYKRVRKTLRLGTTYRNPEKLMDLVIYCYHKMNHLCIDLAQLLTHSVLTRSEFNAFMIQFQHHFPDYSARNRKQYILQKISYVRQHFNLDMTFYFQSEKIVHHFWNAIQETKDDVIAGVASAITILCMYHQHVSVNAICSLLNIKMSTVHRRVERHLIDHYEVRGFESLVKSSHLIRNLMVALRLMEELKKDHIVQIYLSNGRPLFNAKKTLEYYYLMLQDNQHNPVIFTIKKYRSSHALPSEEKFVEMREAKITERDEETLPLGEVWAFHYPKGPPQEALVHLILSQ